MRKVNFLGFEGWQSHLMDKKVSRFPRGIPTKIAEIQFKDYEDALVQLRKILEKWQPVPSKDDNLPSIEQTTTHAGSNLE